MALEFDMFIELFAMNFMLGNHINDINSALLQPRNVQLDGLTHDFGN